MVVVWLAAMLMSRAGTNTVTRTVQVGFVDPTGQLLPISLE